MIVYVDMPSGISGDMFLGALVDLGTPVDWLVRKLSKVTDGFKIEATTVYPRRLKAVDITVVPTGSQPGHRHYSDIRAMIKAAPLSDDVKQGSLEAFRKIAEAESVIHGKDMAQVHFHEVGAIDSLVDIIGTFLCVEYLGIKQVSASPVSLGSGTVECAHGVIPVPVPATLAILKDTPVRPSDARTEIVTPTGAALITTLAGSFGPMTEMVVKQTGYGAGKRETGSALPNLLRIVAGEPAGRGAAADVSAEPVHVVTANVDDMSPEISGFVMERLMAENALDVCFIPVQMKKNRPGVQIEVLCRKADLDTVIETILTQTTSIGVRYYECERAFLKRDAVDIETRYGRIQVKKVVNPDGSARYIPEYETARAAAVKHSIPLKDVYAHITADAAALDTRKNTI